MTKKINPNLTAEQKLILFEEGTELPGSSELNNEKREGSFHCANCGEKLFDSKTKYESGSGWPSFYESLPDVFETKTDHHIGYARTEYHCKKCGGHHGHIFDDGPEPTGKRFCNNGVCLVFKPKSKSYNDRYDLKKIKSNKNFRVIGMGGSALGSQAIYNFLREKIKKKFLFFNNLNSFQKINKKDKFTNYSKIFITFDFF